MSVYALIDIDCANDTFVVIRNFPKLVEIASS